MSYYVLLDSEGANDEELFLCVVDVRAGEAAPQSVRVNVKNLSSSHSSATTWLSS